MHPCTQLGGPWRTFRVADASLAAARSPSNSTTCSCEGPGTRGETVMGMHKRRTRPLSTPQHSRPHACTPGSEID